MFDLLFNRGSYMGISIVQITHRKSSPFRVGLHVQILIEDAHFQKILPKARLV